MSHMIETIDSLDDWMTTPIGQYLLQWELQQMDPAVSDIFGFHALQLGMPIVDSLRNSRILHRFYANTHEQSTSMVLPESFRKDTPPAVLIHDSRALPFPDQCLDLIVLPHTLDLSSDPHASLREVERVLVPEGKLIICGFNPTSFWGLRQRRSRLYQRLGMQDQFLPSHTEPIGYWRLRDWLRLLSFEIEGGRFGCYRPSFTSQVWLNRFDWMDRAGDRWWPIFGGVYFLQAVKRVRGMRLMGPIWKRPLAASSTQSAPTVNSGTSKLTPLVSSQKNK